MTVIGFFSVDLNVYRWRLDEEPPTDTIGATSSPFAGLLKINTAAFRGTEIDEEETAVLVLTRSHFQHLDDYSTTLRMVATALRYSSPLRFCADVSKVAVVVTEQIYRRYDVRPEFLTGEDGLKVVVALDLCVFLREEKEGEIPADNFVEDEGCLCEFVKVSVPWRDEIANYWGNLRRCVGLGGDCDDDDVWIVEPVYGDDDDDAVAGGVTYFEDDEERRRCDTPEP